MRNLYWLLLFLLVGVAAVRAADQPPAGAPQYLGGPERAGVASSPALLDKWPTEGPPLLWRSKLPSSNSGSNISVAGGKVYLSISTVIAADPAAAGDPQAKVVTMVYCLDAITGAEVWKRELGQAARGWLLPGGTPAVVDGRVYAIYSPCATPDEMKNQTKQRRLVTCCLNAQTGEPIWQAEHSASDTNIIMHGYSYTSPLVAGGLCVVQGTGAVAYDAATGERRWAQSYVAGAHASPTGWRAPDGKWYILCHSSVMPKPDSAFPVVKQLDANGKPVNGLHTIYGLDSATGQVCWAVCSAGGDLWQAISPVVSGNLLIDSDNAGNAVYELGAGAPKQRWGHADGFGMGHYGPTPAVANGFIYTTLGTGGLNLLCQRLDTGETVGKQNITTNMMMATGVFTSPVTADGKVFFPFVGIDQKIPPTFYMLQGGPDFKVLSSFSLPGLIMYPTPTIVDGRLYLRMNDGVACYDLRKPAG